MNKPEAIAHARKLVEHIKGLDSHSDDWKCIHALLVIIEQHDSPTRCVECGEAALCKPALFTKINQFGPLCVGCYAEAEEYEHGENAQFGMGS